jgi:hypothetical protein
MNDKKNDKKRHEEDLPEKGLEKGYANRHDESTQPGPVRRQERPPERDFGDDVLNEEADQAAERARNEGVEKGYANRWSEVAGLALEDLPVRAPFTAPRTVAEPEGGWKPGYPKVYFSVYDRVPPIVVKEPNEEGAVDKANFMTIPPEPVPKELTDAKLRAEYRVGDRAAEYPPKEKDERGGGPASEAPPKPSWPPKPPPEPQPE